MAFPILLSPYNKTKNIKFSQTTMTRRDSLKRPEHVKIMAMKVNERYSAAVNA
jgi:hypothetical protein